MLYIFLSVVLMFSAAAANESNGSFDQIVQWARNNQYFKKLYFKLNEEEFVRLVKEGQNPKAVYIGCSDSRVLPDLLLGTKPGDLFVIRSAGNFVPTYDPNIPWDGVAATIEFAVEVLGIRDIIVCGHSHCGAIQGLYSPERVEKFDYIKKWIEFGQAAKKLAQERIPTTEQPEKLIDLTARLSVLFQLDHLLSYPYIRKKLEEGKVFLHGWYFTIEKGKLEYYDPQKGEYLSIKNIIK